MTREAELEERLRAMEAKLKERETSDARSEPVKRSHKRSIIGATVLTVLLLSAGGYYAYSQTTQRPNQLPAKVRSAVDFPLYTPKDQSKFSLDRQTIEIPEDGVVSYAGTYDGKPIIVTQQADPEDFDMQLVTGGTSHDLEIGKSYTTELGNRLTVVIIAEKTLITISTPQPDEKTINTLASEF